MDFEHMLPDWDFVGGSAQNRPFQFAKETGEDYDIQSGTVQCSVQEYVNGGAPVLSKQFPIYASVDGTFCLANISLTSSETKDMEGCYIYQLMIKDSNDNVAIPFHGRMHVFKNIDPGVLA